MRKQGLLLVVGLICSGFVWLGTPTTADAGFVTFTTQATWSTAAGSSSLENFNAIAPALLGTPSSSSFSGVTGFNGFTLSGNSNGDYVAIAAGTTTGNINGTNFLYWAEAAPVSGTSGNGGLGPTITFNFSQAIKAFAFDWVDTDFTDSYQLTVNATNFENPPFRHISTGSGFFGVVATAGETFTQVTFTQTNAGGTVLPFGVDNVQFAVVDTPEPATMTLLGIGIAGMAGYGWRKRKQTIA